MLLKIFKSFLVLLQLNNNSKGEKVQAISQQEGHTFQNQNKASEKETCFSKKGWGCVLLSGYKLTDTDILQDVLKKSCICKCCKKSSSRIIIQEDRKARNGLAQPLIFKCENCAAETATYTRKIVNTGISAFDVNLRSTYASLPFGLEGLAKFCGTMDLPPPLLMDSYNKLPRKLGEVPQKIAESSMKDAGKRLIDLTMDKNSESIDVLEDWIVVANPSRYRWHVTDDRSRVETWCCIRHRDSGSFGLFC